MADDQGELIPRQSSMGERMSDKDVHLAIGVTRGDLLRLIKYFLFATAVVDPRRAPNAIYADVEKILLGEALDGD